MNLVIDIGNTASKLALFDGKELVDYNFIKGKISIAGIERFVAQRSVKRSVISAVAEYDINFNQLLQSEQVLYLNEETPLPIKNLYKTPETLGQDRIACAVGSKEVYPETNTLVIDFVTCIKYDFVDSTDQYMGGAISPGMHMRYKSLNTFTDKLPLLESETLIDWLGDDTNSSMVSGVLNGIIQEVEGIISQYKSRFDDVKVIITGGDHKIFAKALKNVNIADPFLLLKGLNAILKYNDQKL